MAGHYQYNPLLQPYYDVNTGQYVMPTHPQSFLPQPHNPFQSLSSENLHAAYSDYDDAFQGPGSVQGVKARRRGASASDHVKHRRTRSGCYTCRNRRVKCDETHPICERCRKGNRECIYPDSSSSKAPRATAVKGKPSPQSSVSSNEDQFQDAKESLAPIPDDEEIGDADAGDTTSLQSLRRESVQARDASATPSLTNDKSPSPATEDSLVTASSHQSGTLRERRRPSRPELARRRSALPSDIEFFLNWHRQNLSSQHFGLRHDPTNFFKTTFLDIAAKNEPLLYAVVGFSAYHYTLTKSTGKLQDFLKYYHKSIFLLRLSLQRNEKHTVATLLTILQLATFEELLGDWANLIGHQKAAYEIISSTYTPQSIMQKEPLRIIISWYMRFDIVAGFLSGNGTIISIEWFEACHQYYLDRLRESPNNRDFKYGERFTHLRVVSIEATLAFARKGKGLITDDEFNETCDRLQTLINNLESQIPQELADRTKLVKDFGTAPPREPEDVFDPYDPEFLFGDDCFITNYLLQDYWAFQMTFSYQRAFLSNQPPPPECQLIAMKICKMFEAVEFYPQSPPGVVLSGQSAMNMAVMFLPQDQSHRMWARRKMAKVEAKGYVAPIKLREQLSALWGEDVTHWWLPNDEGCPPVIRSIRNWITERTTEPRDQTGEDLREMKGLFSSLNVRDKGKGRFVDGSDVSSEQSFDTGLTNTGDAMIYEGSPENLDWSYGSQNNPPS